MVNQKMRDVLSKREILERLAKVQLEPTLAELAQSDVIELKGCYFLSSLVVAWDDDDQIQRPENATEVECEEHIHVSDYLSGVDRRESALVLTQGLLYSYALWQNLKSRGAFTITLAFEGPGYTPDSEVSDANIRFNKNREGVSCLDLEDLDSYMNAVLILDTTTDLDSELKKVLQKDNMLGYTR